MCVATASVRELNVRLISLRLPYLSALFLEPSPVDQRDPASRLKRDRSAGGKYFPSSVTGFVAASSLNSGCRSTGSASPLFMRVTCALFAVEQSPAGSLVTHMLVAARSVQRRRATAAAALHLNICSCRHLQMHCG
jgi:hypothetical protein